MGLVVTCAASPGCRRGAEATGGADVAVVGESARLRLEDAWPATSPWFDGSRVSLVAARGETLGLQVLDRAGESVSLAIAGADVQVRGYVAEGIRVRRKSTDLYGGSHGEGTYPDALRATAHPAGLATYFEVVVGPGAAVGTLTGSLRVGAREIPVSLAIATATLPALGVTRVWAYEDPRELAWQRDPGAADPDRAVPSADERACVAMFREHGVLLSPDLDLAWWPTRRSLLVGATDVPVVIPTDPALAAEAVRGWIAATQGTGQVPFAIPYDEPADAATRAKLRALGDAAHAAGAGPTTFRVAVTDEPRAEYGAAVDLYISWKAAHREGDRVARWTYNGAPPFAGSVVLDAVAPGTRTWGWIGWRYDIATWYVWDALYWHDRYNRHGAALPGRPLHVDTDATSFDGGEDHGNLDGVLALPGAGPDGSPDGSPTGGCRPTLRLASLRRGLQDRQLLEAAARCNAAATAAIASALFPVALADARPGARASWPADDAIFELARRQLVTIASCPR